MDALSETMMSWMNVNGFDSDAVFQDVIESSDSVNSNIAQHFPESIDTIVDLGKSKCCPPVSVVGISGCTRSGKSTLTKALQRVFGGNGCCSVHQDDYFESNKFVDEQLNGNWDRPDAIRHDAFYENVQRVIAQNKECVDPNRYGLRCFYVILEGFMLYHDDRIHQLVDHPVWVEISREKCIERRKASPNWTHNYWDEGIWRNHEQYTQRVFEGDRVFSEKVLVLDGTQSVDTLVQTTLDRIGFQSER